VFGSGDATFIAMELPKPTPPSSKHRLILNPSAGALPGEAILSLDPFL